MMRSHKLALVALAGMGWGIAGSLGCQGDDAPGPGGSTLTGDVASAAPGDVEGIVVLARSGGDESTTVTDSSGGFLLTDAPTGEIDLAFRRGTCEASLPFGAVPSNSTLTVSGVDFVCTDSVGSASAAGVGETFQAVVRNEPNSSTDDLELCVRVGSDNRNRTVNLTGAAIFNQSGNSTSFSAINDSDLVEIDGARSGPGDTFGFDTQRVRILERDQDDNCDDDPFT